MNTKMKGNIGEIRAIYEFIKRGIPVAIPFGDNERYDLIAEFNGKLNKIQVKYSSLISESGAIRCQTHSSYKHRREKEIKTYENDIDYFVFYLTPWDEIIIIPIEEVGVKREISVRKDLPKNNQRIGITFVEDFLFDKIIKTDC